VGIYSQKEPLNMSKTHTSTVKIDFGGIQTFLFSTPFLRDMVGANVLLAECIRNDLTNLLLKGNYKTVDLIGDTDCQKSFPQFDDPLSDPKYNIEYQLKDDPVYFLKQGIESRDGGRFYVQFSCNQSAEDFVNKAKALIREQLPTIRFKINIEPTTSSNSQKDINEFHSPAMPTFLQQDVLEDLKPANTTIAENTATKKQIYVSSATKQRRVASTRFFSAQRTKDIIGLLQNQLKCQYKKYPKDFNDMCGDDYLAVIHADGNGIGDAFKAHREKSHKNVTVHSEAFFFEMRSRCRAAVISAINLTFQPQFGANKPIDKIQPYQLLMLGGDDLVLTCKGEYAFTFIKHYAKKIAESTFNDSLIPNLSIGAGIVLSKPSVPFHHLHALAEQLATNAKKWRVDNKIEGSVVDWIITSQSRLDELKAVRQAQVIEYKDHENNKVKLNITAKPYVINQPAKQAAHEFSGNLEDAWQNASILAGLIKDKKMSRSQFRFMAEQIPKGKYVSELAYQELSLENLVKKRSIWHSLDKDNHEYVTQLYDEIELIELALKSLNSNVEVR
jgi:hypothetical protein